MAARKSTALRRRARRIPSHPERERHAKALCLLQLAQAVVITVTGALRQQNADHDVEFALALQRGADDPLDQAIELLGGYAAADSTN